MPQGRSAGLLSSLTPRPASSEHTASTSSTMMANCPAPFRASSRTSGSGSCAAAAVCKKTYMSLKRSMVVPSSSGCASRPKTSW